MAVVFFFFFSFGSNQSGSWPWCGSGAAVTAALTAVVTALISHTSINPPAEELEPHFHVTLQPVRVSQLSVNGGQDTRRLYVEVGWLRKS